MKRKTVFSIFIVSLILLSGCSLLKDIIGDITRVEGGDGKKEKNTVASSYKEPEIFCNYMHYFRARNNDFSQWWFPGKDPNRNLGPEPWRRELWIGRTGDYPYIGPYDNIEDKEIMRWHIRLARASGITAFFLAINNWEDELSQTDRLLEVAAEENFKIGFMEAHSFLGAVPRTIFDGHRQPIPSRKYVGYDQIMEHYSKTSPILRSSGRTRYIKPESRSLRDVPKDALEQAVNRITEMLRQRKSHPAYLRIDGKPVIVIPYMDMKLTPAEFKTLTDGIRSHVEEELYIIAVVPFVYWYFHPDLIFGTGITYEWANSGADAFTHWTPNGMVDATQKTRLKVTKFNVKDSLKWNKDPIIPVMPGFNDDTWQPGDHPAPSSPRNNGQAWSDQLDAAIAAKPRFIYIQAWNEWHEGSQIEPSTHYSDPYLYLKILAQKLNKPWQTPPLPPQSSVDPLRLPYLPH